MTRTSIMVRQLDTNKTAELIKKGYKLTIDITGEPMAVVNTPKGLATICSEGVGWWKNDDGEYLVGYYTEPFGNKGMQVLFELLNDKNPFLKLPKVALRQEYSLCNVVHLLLL